MKLALAGLGGLFGLFGPLNRVMDYLKGVKEEREVEKELGRVLQSLHHFVKGIKESQKNGKALVAKIEALEPLVTVTDVEDLMRLSEAYNTTFQTVLSSMCDFGAECHHLTSGNFEGFMHRVKTRKPDVHDVLTFFGRNYDPRTGSMDLSGLPILMRLYGPEMGWREDKDASEAVAEAKKKLEKMVRIAKGMKGRHLSIQNRRLLLDYVRSIQRLARESRRITMNRQATNELRRSAPSWYLEMVDFVQNASKSLPGASGSALR